MQPVHARPTPPVLAVRGPAPGFFEGVRCFFGGFALLARAPGALALALVPIGAAFVISAGFLSLMLLFVPGWVDQWIGTVGWWVPIVKVVALATFSVISVLLALTLAQPASGPALEAIVRRVERQLGLPEQPSSPFVTEIVRSAGSAMIGLTGAVVSFLGLFLMGLIPGAVVVTVPLQFIAMAFCIGWDVCDYPLSVRGIPLGERIRFIFSNARAILGFSLGIAICALVPCGFLLILPVGVAGATALVRAIQASRGETGARALGPGTVSKISR